MVKTKFKKAVSLMLATVMSLTAFMGIGATTAFAAVGEKADVYLVDYPRSGDTNNNGEWGHGNLNYMNGWKGLSTKYTGLRAMGSYSGNIAYCIEPGTGQRTGDTLTEKDENFFNNINPNGTISGDDIRLLIGRILQYGYRFCRKRPDYRSQQSVRFHLRTYPCHRSYPAWLRYRSGRSLFEVSRPVSESQRLPDPCGRYHHHLCQGNPDPYYRLKEHSYQTGHTWRFRYAPNLKGGANR